MIYIWIGCTVCTHKIKLQRPHVIKSLFKKKKKHDLKTLRNENQDWSVPPSDALTFTSSSLFLLLITTIEPQDQYVNVSS